ncbi:SAM domain-containing protein SAMSN-1b [Sebastes umbrosus]|uniref:SAM domain-containing protein SAMSN-1b n=1 Tax=Sebastes umbrosus TaxID=72105 RepID=UPI00189C87E1|nr:SAM domain-containing protein SAMSN-1b [Sebastes umbrosus]
MNLFCFTLEGSTESIYEPPYRQTLKDVLPSYQCSPSLHRRKPEWGGSDPAITSDRPQSTAEVKWDNRRSCVPTSPSENETLDRDINYSCCMSSGDNKDFSHQMKETCKASRQSSVSTRDDRVKELDSDRTQTDLPAQAGETAADTTESLHTTGRLKKLQNLVQTKTGHPSGAGRRKRTSENHDVLRNNNPVLTCIGLGRRAEKKPSKAAASPQQQASDVHGESEEDRVWSPRLGNYLWNPFECPQPWTPFYHTCHLPQHKLSVCAGTPSSPRTSEWDRFESLIQELDSRQSDPSPPEMIGSITDLQQLSQNTLTRFGRFEACRQPSPLMKPRDDAGAPKEQSRDPSNQRRKTETETSPHRDRKHVEASPEKTLTAITSGNTQRDEAEKRRVGGGRSFSKGRRRSRNSLESLYSLTSGQSSSSGVTSGSGCSSNRDSLRLEDDLSYTRQLCGRAKVHTDFVPSPYDTESLKLKVGDVIDIIAKPSMGIWTGMLNGRMGNFKFIYVDVLTEETQSHRVTLKSTVQEVLKRLSMEEHLSSLQLNGYQTVEDLMRLREHHLTELNVTDPEHRHRLLAAVRSLQRLHTESQSENEANREAENTKADMNNCPRDSGCHMPSDSPDSCPEDPDLPFISEYPRPAETAAS